MFNEAVSLEDKDNKATPFTTEERRYIQSFKENFQLDFETIHFYAQQAEHEPELRDICKKEVTLSLRENWYSMESNDEVERWATSYIKDTTFIHKVEEAPQPCFGLFTLCGFGKDEEFEKSVKGKTLKMKKEFLSARKYIVAIYLFMPFLLVGLEGLAFYRFMSSETRKVEIQLQRFALEAFKNGTCSVNYDAAKTADRIFDENTNAPLDLMVDPVSCYRENIMPKDWKSCHPSKSDLVVGTIVKYAVADTPSKDVGYYEGTIVEVRDSSYVVESLTLEDTDKNTGTKVRRRTVVQENSVVYYNFVKAEIFIGEDLSAAFKPMT